MEVPVNTLLADPNDPNVVYAGTGELGEGGNGLYRSDDAGVTWERKTDGLPNVHIDTLAICGTEPLAICAAAEYSIYVTTDAAESWQLRGSDVSNGFWRIASAAASPTRLYGVDSTTYVSEDGGATWGEMSNGLVPGGFIATLVADPNDPLKAWVGYGFGPFDGEGVYGTANGGSTWEAVNTNIESESVAAIWTSSTGTLYAGTNDGEVWSLASGEDAWTLVLSEYDTISAIYAEPALEGSVFVLEETLGVTASCDDGVTWRQLVATPSTYYYGDSWLLVLPLPQPVLLAGGEAGLFRRVIQ